MATPTASQTSRLIQAAITLIGSEAKLGRATGYSQNAIWCAKTKGKVSAEMAVAIDRATKGTVAKYRLRPDLFHENAAA